MNLLYYLTYPSLEEARDAGRQLVGKGLAAGVNIITEAYSIYRWQGEIREKGECLLLAQVNEGARNDFEAQALALHSYDTPCLLGFAADCGSERFLQWIASNSGNKEICG